MTDRQSDGRTDKQTRRQMGRQAHKQTRKQAGRLALDYGKPWKIIISEIKVCKVCCPHYPVFSNLSSSFPV